MSVEILLKKFTEVSGISGCEENVRDLMKKELKGSVDKVYEDKVGNLISSKGKGRLKILLTAHMDQIGFMVKYVNDKGFIKINPVGGWDPKILPSHNVKIHTDNGVVSGVIGSKAIHLQEKDEVEKVFKIKQLYVDVGAIDRKDAEKMGIKVGDYVELDGCFTKLNGSVVSGRCFDNRISCAVLTEVMKRVKPKGVTVYGVGSVQEEIGLKGANAAMFGVDPDMIISLDVGLASDPYTEEGETSTQMGNGPIIGIQDSMFVVHSQVKKMLVETAKRNKIPYQLGVSYGGTTEATLAIMTKEGKPGGLVSVPVRYMHTTVETADTKDMENTIRLVTGAVEAADKYF